MMRFAFLMVLGLGFMNATIDPRGQDVERERMLGLLKTVVQREMAFMTQGQTPA